MLWVHPVILQNQGVMYQRKGAILRNRFGGAQLPSSVGMFRMCLKPASGCGGHPPGFSPLSHPQAISLSAATGNSHSLGFAGKTQDFYTL